MIDVSLLLAALAVLPAFGLAAWVWLSMASANEDMRSLEGFKGLHFED
jgi:hypothetical protein